MIKYECEKGTIKFSSKTYARFRRKILERWNDLQEAMFSEAVRLHQSLRGLGSHWARKQLFACTMLAGNRSAATVREFERVLDLHNGKCKRPARNDFPKLKTSVGCDLVVAGGLARVLFDDDARELYWQVLDAVDAREQAHTDPFVKFLFLELTMMTWTQGNGGNVLKHDSAARDDGLSEVESYKFRPEKPV